MSSDVTAWVYELPTLRLTAQQFKDLPEYSATYPTGVYIGKRWKCLLGIHDPAFKSRGGISRWVIREYAECKFDATMAEIKQYRPIVIVHAWVKP